MDNLEEMYKFLENYNFPKLNQEGIENLKRPITSTEIETVIKILPTNRTRWLPSWILPKIYRSVNTYPTQTLLENWRGSNTPKLILQGHHHPDTKTRWKCYKAKKKHKNYRPGSLMNLDARILNKILANRIQQHIKKIIYLDQVGFTPGMQVFFNIHKSINVIHHINK